MSRAALENKAVSQFMTPKNDPHNCCITLTKTELKTTEEEKVTEEAG